MYLSNVELALQESMNFYDWIQREQIIVCVRERAKNVWGINNKHRFYASIKGEVYRKTSPQVYTADGNTIENSIVNLIKLIEGRTLYIERRIKGIEVPSNLIL